MPTRTTPREPFDRRSFLVTLLLSMLVASAAPLAAQPPTGDGEPESDDPGTGEAGTGEPGPAAPSGTVLPTLVSLTEATWPSDLDPSQGPVTVLLALTVATDGSVRDPEALEGPEAFRVFPSALADGVSRRLIDAVVAWRATTTTMAIAT